MVKIDQTIIEAAHDLGSGTIRIFTKIMYNAKNPMEGSIDIFIDIL